MLESKFKIQGDIPALLAKAPKAVECYHPGHWQLMCDLEKDAQEVIKSKDVKAAVSFLAKVAFLKMPYQMDGFRKAKLHERLIESSEEVKNALDALSDIDVQDYAAMSSLAKVPYFGMHGGRAFNSAVMRLVCPEKFAIIDWRNLAVMAGALGFDGLIEPPAVFKRFDKETIFRERGHLLCSQDVYEQYNNIIREIAVCHRVRAADVDLILWSYSIDRKPFPSYPQEDSVFRQTFSTLIQMDSTTRLKDKNISEQITNLTQCYIEALKDLGWLPAEKIRSELRALFGVIREECEAYGRNKPWMRLKIKKITLALEISIKAKSGERLLAHWRRWENMLNTASPNYSAKELPGSMIMEGYLIFEQLIPIREYLEQKYRDSSFEPAEPCEYISIDSDE
jgi:hypothetical protein